MNADTRKPPDVAQTFLALRVWMLQRHTRTLLSLNAPSGRRSSWVARALANPEGGWPQDGGPGGRARLLEATCDRPPPKPGKDGKEPPPHGPVPSKHCTCGIYATTSLDTINWYLNDGPVLGIVELGGRTIPADQGYRAAFARVAAILLIDPALTLPHQVLREVATAYQVPALVPHSTDPAQYRARLGLGASLADEAAAYLRDLNPRES